MIDTSFDFRTDAGGKDADTYSPTLSRYHTLLWSKPLPWSVPAFVDSRLSCKLVYVSES